MYDFTVVDYNLYLNVLEPISSTNIKAAGEAMKF